MQANLSKIFLYYPMIDTNNTIRKQLNIVSSLSLKNSIISLLNENKISFSSVYKEITN